MTLWLLMITTLKSMNFNKHQEGMNMAYYKARYKYEAYESLDGHFPANMVIYYYKGLGCTKKMFEGIEKSRLKARIDSFKWCNT